MTQIMRGGTALLTLPTAARLSLAGAQAAGLVVSVPGTAYCYSGVLFSTRTDNGTLGQTVSGPNYFPCAPGPLDFSLDSYIGVTGYAGRQHFPAGWAVALGQIENITPVTPVTILLTVPPTAPLGVYYVNFSCQLWSGTYPNGFLLCNRNLSSFEVIDSGGSGGGGGGGNGWTDGGGTGGNGWSDGGGGNGGFGGRSYKPGRACDTDWFPALRGVPAVAAVHGLNPAAPPGDLMAL